MTETLLMLLSAVLGGVLVYAITKTKKAPNKTIEASILLEKVKTVLKVVSVEGQFTEIISHQQQGKILAIIPQNKKAILVIKGTAMVGFDLQKLEFQIDKSTKQIRLKELPNPEIISIDTDTSYYDIKENIWSKFSPVDHTKLNLKAKEKIREQILKSNLPTLASHQAEQTLVLIQQISQSFGWRMEIPQISTRIENRPTNLEE